MLKARLRVQALPEAAQQAALSAQHQAPLPPATADTSQGWPRLADARLPAPRLAARAQKQEPLPLQEAVQQLQVRRLVWQRLLLLVCSARPEPCLPAAQSRKRRRFDETIDAHFALGTDPRRGDQARRPPLCSCAAARPLSPERAP